MKSGKIYTLRISQLTIKPRHRYYKTLLEKDYSNIPSLIADIRKFLQLGDGVRIEIYIHEH